MDTSCIARGAPAPGRGMEDPDNTSLTGRSSPWACETGDSHTAWDSCEAPCPRLPEPSSVSFQGSQQPPPRAVPMRHADFPPLGRAPCLVLVACDQA